MTTKNVLTYPSNVVSITGYSTFTLSQHSSQHNLNLLFYPSHFLKTILAKSAKGTFALAPTYKINNSTKAKESFFSNAIFKSYVSRYLYMITKLKNLILSITLFLIPTVIFAQTPPPLGVAADFVLFTSIGAITNDVFSQLTGNIGTNSGACSGFGNVNGQMHIVNAVSARCAIDVAIADTNLRNQIPNLTIGPVLGSGQVLVPNVYLLPAAASIVDTLILDGGGDSSACFVFQIGGALTTAAGATIKLINGTQSINVFWKVVGAFSMAVNGNFKGTIISNEAIALGVGCTFDGRALTTVGAVSVSALTAVKNSSYYAKGPLAPNMQAISCSAVLASSGIVKNTGTTNVVGDIGSNSLSTSGFNQGDVVGLIHPTPDHSTSLASSDLTSLETYLNSLPYDIELIYPALFGNSQVLTPNVYLMNAAAILNDTIFLDAKGVDDAVFVIRIMGALTTNLNPQVVLVGGTQANNVFWQVDGAVTIGSGSNFNGIIVANGAIILNNGVILNGKALSTDGHITTKNANITSNTCAYSLPIELLSFTANANDEHVKINWVTASESNNEYFTVEKSLDGIKFEILAKIDGAGNSSQILNYSAVDNAPLNGISYYRLKQTDYSGKTEYSNMVAVEFKIINDFIFNIYPNPNDGEVFNLQISNNDNEEVLVVVYDILNKEVFSKVIVTSNNDKEVYAIYPSQKLNPGVYLMTVASGNKIYKKRLIVINNK